VLKCWSKLNKGTNRFSDYGGIKLAVPETPEKQLKVAVDPSVHRATKMLAVSRGVTMSALVQGLLERELEQVPDPR